MYDTQIKVNVDPLVAYTKASQIMSKVRKLSEDLNRTLATDSERPTIMSPAHAANIATPFLEGLDHEELWVMTLNTRNAVTGFHKLYAGSVNSSQVRIAEVFRQAIISNSPAIIIFHNHPSGDPNPSPDDENATTPGHWPDRRRR